MKQVIFYIVIVIGVLTLINGSTLIANELNLSLQICQFRFNSDTTLVEVYYGLGYQSDDVAQDVASIPSFVLSLSISKNDKIVTKNIWQMEGQNSTEQRNQQVLIDVMKYLLIPGNYNFKIVAKQLSSTELIDSTEINNFTIRAIKSGQLEMSDIELARDIQSTAPESKDRFYKNRFRVTPNPLNVYGIENKQIYYYFELYNLGKINSDCFYIKRTIVDNNGLPLPSLPEYEKKKRIRGQDAVEVGMFDVSQLPSGKYFITFTIHDSSKIVHRSSQTPYYVYNPEITLPDRNTLPIEQQMASSEFALLSPEDLDVIAGVTNYIANDEDKKVINNLMTVDAKRIFLYRFWRERDQEKSTPVLESFREVMTRVRYANENFKQLKTHGWRTDRGRVLIIYGKPSLIQYYSNVPAFKEFQAWSYDHIEQGVVFIFGVLTSFGELELIHSTKTGEKYNDGWFDLIKVTSGTTGMAEDFAGNTNRGQTFREIFQQYNLELPRYLK